MLRPQTKTESIFSACNLAHLFFSSFFQACFLERERQPVSYVTISQEGASLLHKRMPITIVIKPSKLYFEKHILWQRSGKYIYPSKEIIF